MCSTSEGKNKTPLVVKVNMTLLLLTDKTELWRLLGSYLEIVFAVVQFHKRF